MQNPLDHVFLNFSDVDPWTGLMSVEGTILLGSPGSGKSSTAGKQIALAFLRAGLGGLVCVAKGEETRIFIEYAKACGRENDLIIFNSESGLQFDPVFYEYNRDARGGADHESIIDLLTMFTLIGKKESDSSNDKFFEQNTEKLIRHSVVLLSLAQMSVSIENINQVIESLPSRPGEFEEEGWQSESFCAELLASVKARQEELSEEQWSDFAHVSTFFFKKWPSLAPETSSSIEATWSGRADKFLFNPYKRTFCGGRCDFTPEMTYQEGKKIIVIDFPVLEMNETGQTINCLMKLVFQRAWLRRQIEPDSPIAFCFSDEFQLTLLPKNRDNLFAQTCRSSRIANVCITQSILNLSEQLGESRPGSKTKAFLGNLATKIFMQQNDVDTNLYAADLIGKEYRYLRNFGVGGDSVSSGQSESRLYRIDPELFSQLRKPDTRNRIAQAIVYIGGASFNATRTKENPNGRNFVVTGFSR